MRNIASFHILLGFILINTISPCFSTESKAPRSESKSIQAVREFADTASRPYAVVVDEETLEHPEWGQVVEALQKKYNAKIFVAHYPDVRTVRKALNEYMPWYVCFVAQPEQATREMITAAAYTMTWLDDDPYEDAIWAVLTGFVAEDALRIVNAEPLFVRKELSNTWDGWLDWLEGGVSLSSDSDYKFIKNSDGVKQQLEGPKERIQEFVEVLNQDDCDIITTSAHATEHVFYLGYPNTASDGYITHNEKGDIYGIDTLGKVHHVNAKKPKIYYSPGNCLIGHIDGQSCLSLAWIHNGVNAFFGHMYNQDRPCYAWAIAEYFIALQGQYTFAEATYANWLALRFSVDEQLEVYLCCDRGGKGTVLYGDPAWEARLKRTVMPAYSQDLDIEYLADDRIKITARITIHRKWQPWVVPEVRPIILLPFRIKEARIKNTDLDRVGVADNFIVLDLDTPSIGGSDLPVGTKKSVVLYARKLEVWPFLTDNEVITRVKQRKLDNISRRLDFLADETVDPNERITKAAVWHMLFPTSELPVASYQKRTELLNMKDKEGRTLLHLAVESADRDIVELLLNKGAKLDEKDDESGFTALHHAARLGNRNAAELLIAMGADLNAKDKQGHTPLYVAANHDYKVAELLMSKGADSAIQTEPDRTLLELAQQRKQTESTVPDMIFDGEPNSFFGGKIVCGDVDGDGYDDILIEALRYNNNRGRVCLFYGGPGMDTTADLILEGENEGDFFGNGIACGDIDHDGYEDIVIAASQYSEKRGRAYLYWGSDRNSMDAKPDKIFIGEEEKGSEFGTGHPAVYDIDNDGYDDIILGACASGNRTGRAYLYYGNTKELMDTSHDLIFTGENRVDRFFGYTISCGDVDNDGFGDIVVGGYDNQGRAYLYYGASKSNMDAKADVVFKGESEGGDYFGTGIVCVDQNGDGYDDVVIGAPSCNDWQGRTHLFHGNSKGSMDTDPDMIFDGEVESSNYGFREVCGDIDGDKVNDIVIGAYCYRQRVGRVYVYSGHELSAPNPTPGRILTGEGPGDEFGLGLACGDVNNDGFDDLVVGAWGYKAGANQGRAYLYYGGPRKK